ncbi:glycosyltransferase family 2 protein [Dysgonomonas capnocytophagoides]|uniref:Glycosyltransferase family 2 protein n=1 Tax=Dysgonomonas capnocytophagoides TaxID=45254 RepID=A0A4Y8L5C5_9BACT|nr:glycosyltransferase family A protein [Dysgonomonas capnocytophagoides]TFD97849.1 glycosyltransferase family 2 protein [Dysgonomonas capnocytophagoides]
MDGFSIIMPTYNDAFFIRRAIHSVFEQSYKSWELIIINDGSTDLTDEIIKDYQEDQRVIYLKNINNEGVSYSINRGLEIAHYDYIAYLPSDDYYFKDHLNLLKRELDADKNIVLTFTAAKYNIKDSFTSTYAKTSLKQEFGNLFCDSDLQLVQTAHKKTQDRWDIDKLLSPKNYFNLFWIKLVDKGLFSSVNKTTCCWSTYYEEESQHISNTLKPGVKLLKEEKIYNRQCCISNKKLKILLVGDLSYNSDRILALKDYGHELYGLWAESCEWSTNGDHLGIKNIPLNDWNKGVERLEPDIIYALLNHMSIPVAYEVLTQTNIPFIWHYKEGPYVAMIEGNWQKLLELYMYSDGQIYLNEEVKNWFELFFSKKEKPLSIILDGDLPSVQYFNKKSEVRKISEIDGEIHTVVAGRIMGFNLKDIRAIFQQKIHIHVYGQESQMLYNIAQENPYYFHLHKSCMASDWKDEFSKYDAGWLHYFQSQNNGELVRANWDDLNIPSRINTMFAAGIPSIQKDNTGHIVAIQNIIKKLDCGVFVSDLEKLSDQIYNKERMSDLEKNVKKHQDLFSFEYHISALLSFFYEVIESKS